MIDKLGIKTSTLTFLGLSIIFVSLGSDYLINTGGFNIGIPYTEKPIIDVQTHRVTSNCDMIFHTYSSSEFFLNEVRCDKEPSLQEWKYLLRYNELVKAELTQDFSEYITNQLMKEKSDV